MSQISECTDRPCGETLADIILTGLVYDPCAFLYTVYQRQTLEMLTLERSATARNRTTKHWNSILTASYATPEPNNVVKLLLPFIYLHHYSQNFSKIF